MSLFFRALCGKCCLLHSVKCILHISKRRGYTLVPRRLRDGRPSHPNLRKHTKTQVFGVQVGALASQKVSQEASQEVRFHCKLQRKVTLLLSRVMRPKAPQNDTHRIQICKTVGKRWFWASRFATVVSRTPLRKAPKTQNSLENIMRKKCTGQPPEIDFPDRASGRAQVLRRLSFQRTRCRALEAGTPQVNF